MARIRILNPNRGKRPDTGNPFIDNDDLAMRENDARLARLENRLTRLYRDAAKDLTGQLNEYLERFEEKDAQMQETLPHDDYIAWRERQILRTAQMEQQIEALTNDMVNADRLAVQMVNGDLPEVYVSSYNYSGYRGELMANAAGYNYDSFALYNADAIRIIANEDPDLIPWEQPSVDIPKDRQWNRNHIQTAIAHGILTGASIPEISASLLPIVNMDRVAATRTARTAYTAVQNQARRDGVARLKAAGIPFTEPWMSVLASNTRDTHLQLHGTLPNKDGKYGEGIIGSGNLLRFPGDPNGDPEQIYNCQCRVQSYLGGIDHSKDDELYAEMMRRDHYQDWVGWHETRIAPDGTEYTVTRTGVKDYKVEAQRRALERKRQLDEGIIENRENRYRRRLQERQGSVAASTGYRNAQDLEAAIVNDGGNLDDARLLAYSNALDEETNYTTSLKRNIEQAISENGYTSGIEMALKAEESDALAFLKNLPEYKTPEQIAQMEAIEKRLEIIRELQKNTPMEASTIEHIVYNEIPDNVRNVYNRFEHQYVNARTEHGMLLSPDGGIISESASKRRESVSIASRATYQEYGNNAFEIHNHTNDVIFSWRDIENYELYGINGTITIPSGYEYSLLNSNDPLWNLSDSERLNRNSFAQAWRAATEEISDNHTMERRAFIDSISNLEKGEQRRLLREWDESNNTFDLYEQWLAEHADEYGFTFRKRKIN